METELPAPRRTRRFFGKIGLLAGVCAALTGAILWYNAHRTLAWEQVLSPIYWTRRFHGDDLYEPQNALLLHGNHDLPEIALTFDDGPHPESRGMILDTLKRYGAKATFFDVGQRMAENPELVRRTLAETHEIANHSAHHVRFAGLPAPKLHREINDTDITFCRITGRHLTLLRPPGMGYDAAVLAETKRLGYVVVSYTTASHDFDPKETSEFIAQRTVSRTHNGSIVLLHDYGATAAALPEILETLRSEGYRFVTVSELMAHLPGHAGQEVRAFQSEGENAPQIPALSTATR